MDTILADVIPERPVPRAHEPDDVLTTGQAAALLGVTRPTLVAWLEAGRIPFHRCGSHRRVHRSDVRAYRKQDRRRSGQHRERLDAAPGEIDRRRHSAAWTRPTEGSIVEVDKAAPSPVGRTRPGSPGGSESHSNGPARCRKASGEVHTLIADSFIGDRYRETFALASAAPIGVQP